MGNVAVTRSLTPIDIGGRSSTVSIMAAHVESRVQTAFGNMPSEAQSALSRALACRHFSHNEFIYFQDDLATNLYFVQSGFVRLSHLMEDGTAVVHAILPSGESFGELGVFEGATYPEMATAVGLVSVSYVAVTTFQMLCKYHPALFYALGQTIAKRYRAYIELTRNLSYKTLAARLAQALLRLADGLGLYASYGGRRVKCIAPIITQTDLSMMARGSRGNVNRALKAWERHGWIAIHERSILIIERRALETVQVKNDL